MGTSLHMNKSPKPWREYGRYGSVGIELVLCMMLGYYAGRWADGKIGGGHGWLTALGFLIGVYAGFRSLFVAAAKIQKDVERQEKQARGDDPWADEVPVPTSTADGESAAEKTDDPVDPPHDR
jgi:ATP synthase protein I